MRRLHAHAEPEWDVRNTEDNHSGVGRRVLRDPSEVALEHVVAVEESLLAVRFDPHLVFAVFCEVVKTSNVELEFA